MNVQSPYDQARGRAMHVSYKDWKCKSFIVTDADTDSPTVLYTIDTKLRKPHLVFRLGENGAVFATVNFHSLSSRIDIEFHGQTLEMKPKSSLSSKYSYPSPVFQNTTMTWSSNSAFKSFDYVCLDEASLPVARFTRNCASLTKFARLEFPGSSGENQAVRDEMLVTGLTLAYMMSVINAAAPTA